MASTARVAPIALAGATGNLGLRIAQQLLDRRAVVRVLYWGSADQPLDFTAIADPAVYTAGAALYPTAPHYLRIAGQTATVRQLQAEARAATGKQFGRLQAGGPCNC